MLRIALIILPLFAPLLVYALYRWVRYGLLQKNEPAPQKAITLPMLLAAGAILVFLNIVFLVRFNSTPADQVGYHYPQFNSTPKQSDVQP